MLKFLLISIYINFLGVTATGGSSVKLTMSANSTWEKRSNAVQCLSLGSVECQVISKQNWVLSMCERHENFFVWSLFMGIRGIRMSGLFGLAFNCDAWSRLFFICLIMHLVPLQKPLLGLRDRIKIIDAPTFNGSSCGGKPETFVLLSMSTSICPLSLSSVHSSMLMLYTVSPGICSSISALSS